jgi:hypothetical protein
MTRGAAAVDRRRPLRSETMLVSRQGVETSRTQSVSFGEALGDCIATALPSCMKLRASTLPRRPDSGTRRSSSPLPTGHWKTTAFEVRSRSPTWPAAPRAWRRSAMGRRAPRRSSITAAGPAAVFDEAYARLPRQIAGAYSDDVAVETVESSVHARAGGQSDRRRTHRRERCSPPRPGSASTPQRDALARPDRDRHRTEPPVRQPGADRLAPRASASTRVGPEPPPRSTRHDHRRRSCEAQRSRPPATTPAPRRKPPRSEP